MTIPQAIRDELGLVPETEVVFEVDGNTVRIKKANARSGRGSRIVAHMTGRATIKLSTDEIMLLTRAEK